jgi:hypothetical protein
LVIFVNRWLSHENYRPAHRHRLQEDLWQHTPVEIPLDVGGLLVNDSLSALDVPLVDGEVVANLMR